MTVWAILFQVFTGEESHFNNFLPLLMKKQVDEETKCDENSPGIKISVYF